MDPIRDLDVVALARDIPAHGLIRGQVGTVVHTHAPGVVEVEFADPTGATYAMAAVRADELIKLRFEPVRAA